jgi:PST family polysaccharide transporter
MNGGIGVIDTPPASSRLSDPEGAELRRSVPTGLGHKAVRGSVATMAGQFATFLLRTGSAIVLARLLDPSDFGLIAMILAVTAFLTPFKDFGLSTATIQRDALTQGEVSNLFWVNTGVGALLTLSTAIMAPLVARFYREPLLLPIGLALSARFLLEGIAIQHQALLRRQMRFGVLSVLDASSLAAGALLGIYGAWRGWGYWALVVQQLAPPTTVAVGVWFVHRWRPSRPARQSDIRGHVVFGGQLTGSNILYAAASNFDSLLVGWRWGSQALGLYSRAYTLLLLPLQQITLPLQGVAVSTLSRLQHDAERFRRFYCSSVTVLAFVTTPLIVIMGVCAHDIIAVVLGDKWLSATPVFTALAVAQLGLPVAGTINWIYQSLGQSDRMLRWTMVATPLSIVSFVVGLHWGPVGVATAIAIEVHVVRFPALWYAFRHSPVKIRDWIRAVWRPSVVCLIMGLAMFAARELLPDWRPIERLIVCCLAGGVALAGSTLCWPQTRRETIDLTRQLLASWQGPR